jgi:hypothetical protein
MGNGGNFLPRRDLRNVATAKSKLAISPLDRILAQNELDQGTLTATGIADKANGRALGKAKRQGPR